MDVLTKEVAGLPLWAWIVIAVIVIIAIIIIIVVSVSASRKNKTHSTAIQSEKTDKSVKTESAKSDSAYVKTDSAKTEKPVAKKTESVVEEEDDEEEISPAKSNDKVYHISKRKSENKWQIKAAGGAKAIKLFNTQAEAIEYCKTLAENQEARIMIHKEDGSFRKLTYKK